MATTLEQDLAALVAEVADPKEAEALERLLELATHTAWQPKADDTYKPFIYPH